MSDHDVEATDPVSARPAADLSTTVVDAAIVAVGRADVSAPTDEAIDALLFRVRDKGRLSVMTGEIFAAFPGFEPSTDELAAIHARVEAAGMQIVDAEELSHGGECISPIAIVETRQGGSVLTIRRCAIRIGSAHEPQRSHPGRPRRGGARGPAGRRQIGRAHV